MLQPSADHQVEVSTINQNQSLPFVLFLFFLFSSHFQMGKSLYLQSSWPFCQRNKQVNFAQARCADSAQLLRVVVVVVVACLTASQFSCGVAFLCALGLSIQYKRYGWETTIFTQSNPVWLLEPFLPCSSRRTCRGRDRR